MKDQIAIGFAEDLVPLVRSGKKTLTYRYGDKYDVLEVGDVVGVKDQDDKVFGKVEIVDKWKEKFGDIPLDREGQRTYRSHKHRSDIFKKHYKREFKEDDEIFVFMFKYFPD